MVEDLSKLLSTCPNCHFKNFFSESDCSSFGLWLVKVRKVVITQSFVSDGSFLGNKFIERFAGFKQKVFSDVCQNRFLSSLIVRGDKTPFFKVRRNTVEMYVLEHFTQFELKFFGRVVKIAFYVSKVYILGKFFGLCTEYLRTLNESFSAGFQNCILLGVQPNNFRTLFFSICFNYWSHLAAKTFLPESSKLQFNWSEDHFGDMFPIGLKIFWSLRKKIQNTCQNFFPRVQGNCLAE